MSTNLITQILKKYVGFQLQKSSTKKLYQYSRMKKTEGGRSSEKKDTDQTYGGKSSNSRDGTQDKGKGRLTNRDRLQTSRFGASNNIVGEAEKNGSDHKLNLSEKFMSKKTN